MIEPGTLDKLEEFEVRPENLNDVIDAIEQNGYIFELNSDGADEPLYRCSVRRGGKGRFRGYPRAFYEDSYDEAAAKALLYILQQKEER